MRILIRLFFRTLRLVLNPLMLLWEKLSTPQGIQRAPAAQQQVDERTRALVLYQFRTCPFCIKVRKEIARLSLNIELRDAQHDATHCAELEQGGGKLQVPCLRIEDAQGQVRWLYESDAIIAWLRQQFAAEV